MERLLQYFTPEHYDLNLKIDRTRDLIEGTVKIRGEAHTDIIKLHAVNLEILSAKSADNPLDFKHSSDTLEIPAPAPGNIELEISFKTTLNKNMQGCYLSTYQHDGATQKIAATQFESHYARECFPCIDEPAAKATFDLTLEIPDLAEHDVVLANTPLKTATSTSTETQTANTFTF